ncbi:MAG: prepilin-type N-terminal cleavage/methylation domain-containing protein [Deltaproteobacteria bacterium]|nr:prepilin-type N-terminal cleavage/methylation domain-containing protein [Deltaproteobacteria bacterium]MBW2129461.1 prepilin-type N-terminal cleavage/methylation domain-containing protein [Deltaproteobacteria bacterium]MBW2302170.1 prepilin-type N-terminal cleavage/methylation domain-containing protein [Deltaproteobacteria bacterium]
MFLLNRRNTSGRLYLCVPECPRGFTLIEALMVMVILGTIGAIALPLYTRYIEKAKVTKAIAEISILQKEILNFQAENDAFPANLGDIGRGNLKDPWGAPYQYMDMTGVSGHGKCRKDHFMNPLNTDFDLYSMGPDGISKPPLTAKASRDDIVRADNGGFIGPASEF